MNRLYDIIRFILLVSALSTIFVNKVEADSITNNPHDIPDMLPASGLKTSSCLPCHMNSKSFGPKKIWTLPSQGVGPEGFIGNMCYACHSSNVFGSSVLIEASFAEKYVYPDTGLSKYSHGLDIRDDYADFTTKSNLPYAEKDDEYDPKYKNKMQCTTCHDIHANKRNRPFLKLSIDRLCKSCHLVKELHKGYKALYLKTLKPDIIVDENGLAISLRVLKDDNINALFYRFLPFDNPSGSTDGLIGDKTGRWNLGMHLVSKNYARGIPGSGLEGKVSCISCHAVHGVQDDSDANSPIDLPKKFMLPIMNK